jgi:hypothetical protein
LEYFAGQALAGLAAAGDGCRSQEAVNYAEFLIDELNARAQVGGGARDKGGSAKESDTREKDRWILTGRDQFGINARVRTCYFS